MRNGATVLMTMLSGPGDVLHEWAQWPAVADMQGPARNTDGELSTSAAEFPGDSGHGVSRMAVDIQAKAVFYMSLTPATGRSCQCAMQRPTATPCAAAQPSQRRKRPLEHPFET
jgi:hypothetical protein